MGLASPEDASDVVGCTMGAVAAGRWVGFQLLLRRFIEEANELEKPRCQGLQRKVFWRF